MYRDTLRYDQNQAYEESLLQDILKKTKPDKNLPAESDKLPAESDKLPAESDKLPAESDKLPAEPDQKLTMAELREKRIQAFSAKKTSTISNGD
jgi:hypothetical protein